MLKLVRHVDDYPNFISLISAVRILDHKVVSDHQEEFTADVGIQYKFISEQFRSIVQVDAHKRTLSIARAGHGGAVRSLRNDWVFHPLNDGSTLIDFDLNVRMKAAPLEFLIKQKFEKATHYIMNSFEQRAHELFARIGAEDYNYTEEARAFKHQRSTKAG
jgi:coenzyme Q-binding protein COQ10